MITIFNNDDSGIVCLLCGQAFAYGFLIAGEWICENCCKQEEKSHEPQNTFVGTA